MPPASHPAPMDPLQRDIQAARVRQSAHVELAGPSPAQGELQPRATDQLEKRGSRDAVGAGGQEDDPSGRELELPDVRPEKRRPGLAPLPAVEPVNDTENALWRV